MAFLATVRARRPGVRLLGLGDIFLEPEPLINHPELEAVITDFTSTDLVAYLEGHPGPFPSLRRRSPNGVVDSAAGQKRHGEFRIPIPDHERFIGGPYQFPFARYHPYATILTDFGCPFSCRFCIYSTLGYRWRPIDNVVPELHCLRGLGVRELFIKDQCFAPARERALDLCRALEVTGPFSWSCFLRADLAEIERLRAMRRAGCHTVLFGVETANREILMTHQKGMTPEDNERAFALCREVGIATVGIFMLGFPGEDEASCRATIDLAMRLDADYSSFNVFVPKPGTPARHELEASGQFRADPEEILDQSGLATVWSAGTLSAETLQGLREEAMRRFYGRPEYVWRRLRRVRTFHEFHMLASSAIAVVRDMIQAKRARRAND
jgi:anaerobic magnesium-protoporphyrin IX monomethyl ester cyclase